MEGSKGGTQLKLDPKIQELYARLEEEKKKNRQLDDIKRQNAQLLAKINQLENDKLANQKKGGQNAVQNIRKDLAHQNLLEEQKIRDKMLENKQHRIERLISSLDDQEEIHELDTRTIEELRLAIETLIQSRNKRSLLIKRLNEQNKVLSEQNEDLLFTRDKLAHDLRSLMASIISTLSLIDLGETEVVGQILPALEAKCRVFMDLVVTLNEDKIKKDHIYINDIIELLNLVPEGQNRKINIEVTGIDVPIYGDKSALYDVAQNLINNAVKYSGRQINELKIHFEVSQHKSFTTLTISDNGKGIPKEKSQKIFELYNRAGVDDAKGKGIGLFMAQKLVERHQGTISYNQSFEYGAQFVINLPCEPIQ